MINPKTTQELLNDIPVGESNAISALALSKLWNTDKRNTTRIVTNLCISGNIIASNHHGYFIPENDIELKAHFLHTYSGAMTMLKRLKAVRSELKRRGINPNSLTRKGREHNERKKK